MFKKTDESLAKMKASKARYWSSPENRNAQSLRRKAYFAKEENRLLTSIATKKGMANPEFKKKFAIAITKSHASPEYRARRSVISKQVFQREDVQKKHKVACKNRKREPHTQETKEKQSISAIKTWQDSEIREKRMFSWSKSRKMNNWEKIVDDLLQAVLPSAYRYTGNFSESTYGLYPDWKSNKGNMLIELFGERWHKPQDEQDRANCFKQFGYETLVIWGRELKDIETLKSKILLWHTKHHDNPQPSPVQSGKVQRLAEDDTSSLMTASREKSI